MAVTIRESYDKYFGNENYKFVISGGGATASEKIGVSGFMQNELSIAGANSYSSVAELISNASDVAGSIFGSKVGGLISLAKSGKELMNVVNQATNTSNVTDYESRLIWGNSANPTFSIDYTFYNTSATTDNIKNDALSQALNLQKGVLPTKGAPAKSRPGIYFRSPLGYKPKLGKAQKASGLVSLQVGKWFKATELIIESTNFTPSTQVMSDGRPLYVKGNVVLKPYELITYDKFMSYFLLHEQTKSIQRLF